MASNQTEHYGLNQWAGNDKFIRTEFNEDNARIDAALAGKAERERVEAIGEAVELRGRIRAATYLGNGAESQFIDVGFSAKAVLVEYPEGYRALGSSTIFGGLALPGADMGNGSAPVVSVTGNGFYAYHRGGSNGTLNKKGDRYYYVAFG